MGDGAGVDDEGVGAPLRPADDADPARAQETCSCRPSGLRAGLKPCSYAGARGRPGFGLTCVWPREPIRSQRKAWLKPGLPGVRDPLSAAGEAADRTGDAALGVNDGPAPSRAAGGTGE